MAGSRPRTPRRGVPTLCVPTLFLFLAYATLAATLRAETGHDAWLRYEPIKDTALLRSYDVVPALIYSLDDSEVEQSAQSELIRGISGMLGPRIQAFKGGVPEESCILLGTFDKIRAIYSGFTPPTDVAADGYLIKFMRIGAHDYLVITAPNDRGVLYGAFALLRKISVHEPVADVNVKESPSAPIRYINEWDNLDGTIERGYGGRSIFWEADHIVPDLSNVRDYARLLASLGINGCSINNVNADPRVISTEYLKEIARVADAFRPWGVKMLISLDFASPRKIGGIQTYDPLDPQTVDFWKRTIDGIYAVIPDLGGFVVKADSEGRLGPSEYNRTHADAANVIARAAKPHGGVLFYRGFVYNNRIDYRDLTQDRAKAAYDNFHKLDGTFDDNVIIQIKNGPIDFQVREPPSPLFGGLEKTNMAVELQITQEYLGQQRQVVFTVPMWKATLDFDLQTKGVPGTPVKSLVTGQFNHQKYGGFVGVANVGREQDWLGHHLAMANLYGFGRLAWNPDLSSADIAAEWTKQTFGSDPEVVSTVDDILLKSWKTYENYTGNLGIGGLTDIISVHYGPAVESSEKNGWGQWHRSDAVALGMSPGSGMNRSIKDGTGFIGQYSPPVAQMFESLETCPDDLLLFMHHVSYTYVLHDGKTVIQHMYDAHYEGAEQAEKFYENWQKLKGKIDDQRYNEVLARLEYQAGYSIVWRDAINNWFLKISGVPDEKGRAGHFPDRTEAENMTLDGYVPIDVTPWEAASGGQAVKLISPDHKGSVSYKYSGEPGNYDIVVQYFDTNDGASTFKLFTADKQVDTWVADDLLPTPYNSHSLVDSHTSTRRATRGVTLKTGDEIRVEAVADGKEWAAIDYVEISPHKELQRFRARGVESTGKPVSFRVMKSFLDILFVAALCGLNSCYAQNTAPQPGTPDANTGEMIKHISTTSAPADGMSLPDDSSLSLSIMAPSDALSSAFVHPNRFNSTPPYDRIVAENPTSHFDLVITNTSTLTLKLPNLIDQLGRTNVTFNLEDSTGKKWTTSQVNHTSGSSTGFMPSSPWVLPPQSSALFEIYFADPNSWQGFPEQPLDAEQIFTIQAVLNLPSNTVLGQSRYFITSPPETFVFVNRLYDMVMSLGVVGLANSAQPTEVERLGAETRHFGRLVINWGNTEGLVSGTFHKFAVFQVNDLPIPQSAYDDLEWPEVKTLTVTEDPDDKGRPVLDVSFELGQPPSEKGEWHPPRIHFAFQDGKLLRRYTTSNVQTVSDERKF